MTLGAEDRAQLDELIARYNRAINNGDRAEFLSVFTEDAVWISPMGGRYEGHEQLGAFLERLFSEDRFEPVRAGQHWVTNRIFGDVRDDGVSCWSNFMFILPRPTGVHIAMMGNYRDEFSRRGGRWLLRHRTVEIVGDDSGRVAPTAG